MLFNTKTSELVIFSGAIKSAGLNSIDAKNMALASQSLGIIIALIPFIRDSIDILIPVDQKSLLKDFDKIIKEFKDNQNELYMNIVYSLKTNLESHLANINVIWLLTRKQIGIQLNRLVMDAHQFYFL